MQSKALYIQTIGCQMNVYDSERIAKLLAPLNYQVTTAIGAADLIIVNTCAIREKAEQKVFSFLGRLAGLKKNKPNLIIGVGGCVAQQQGEKILKRVPFVNLVFGTHAIGRLARMVEKVEQEKGRLVDVALSTSIEAFETLQNFRNDGKVTSFVTIMQGCDNFCTYCVVPYVRGREASRPPEQIVEEIRSLVNCGIREVTLLGQNVNSYGQKEGLCTFPELLARINEIEGLLRIRFTTSHPKDLSTGLCRSYRDLDKLCKHIHLPVQSGSNHVLRRMNRNYTRESYLEKVGELRHYYPGIAISSDFIVGFPGETPKDFEQTLDLIETVQFDSLFAFKYSDRPDTPASSFKDKVPEKAKIERLRLLLDLQNKITVKKHRTMVGSIQEVLVEGLSKKQAPTADVEEHQRESNPQWNGRTSPNKIVNFGKGTETAPLFKNLTGRLVRVKIETAYAHSLRGTPVGIEPVPFNLKGEHNYAA